MPNPKGNLDWKPKYGETTKVVRLPESLADNVTALLKQEVSAIDVLQQLKSVPLLHRSQLPPVAAVYLVYQSDRLLYIGRTENLKQRWSGHHRQKQFSELEEVRIAWFPCTEDAPLLESTLIELLEPEFNGQEQPNITGKSLINFRCPDDVLEAISDRAVESGESKSSVVISALRYAFGLAEYKGDAVVGKSVLQDLQQRLTELEGKLLA